MASPSGHTRARSTVVPTNSVTTKEGKTVRARIEASLPVADVIRQLCLNLKILQSPTLFALRDEQDQLVTDENLRRHIRDRNPLKLVNSPVADAADYVVKLTKNDSSLKLTIFNLQKLIREDQFAQEFVRRDGLAHLISIVEINQGNTLAYALAALRNLMDYDYGWSTIEPSFMSRLSQILSTPATPINVCRPATSILKKLVEADPRSAPGPATGSSSRAQPALPAGSVWRYGFDVVWPRITPGLLEVVVQRLGSADSGMVLYSMMLLNTLLYHATENHWEALNVQLEHLNVRKAVLALMSSASEELGSSILDFQANLVRITYRRKTMPVDPELPVVQDAVDFIWQSAKVPEANSDDLTVNGITSRSLLTEKWTKIGFGSENVRSEFARVGMLGLDCLKTFAAQDTDYFAKAILEQLNRQAERRCPVGMASNEVVELLTDHWSVFAPGYSTSTSYQPLFLSFSRVHSLATRFFLRMWNESGSSRGDFPRVASLVQSQIRVALIDEANRPWHEVESSFLDSPYREVRERQVRELELQDELLHKPPIRNLRAKLHNESYEFVKQQRTMCLMQGAWFANGVPVPTASSNARDSLQLRRPNRPWRFYRLDRSQKYLYFVDSAVKIQFKNGLEDFSERIEVSQITDIGIGTCTLPPNIAMPEAQISPYGSAPTTSPLSFTIMTSQGPLADHVSENASRFSDWVDGLNMLRNSQITTKDTEMFVNALTEIGLKIKLLDLSAEKVDIPSSLPDGPPPSNTDYYFSDPVMFA